MKAIQVVEPGKMELIEVPMPKIKNPKDVLVKIRAFGICGSDVGIFKGKNPFAIYPRIIGHEACGEVYQVGDQVKDLKVGDKVVLEPIEFCGECYACRHERHNVCKDLQVYGVHREGGFCEYLVADRSKWHKVDDNMSFEHAVVAEPYTIAEQSTSRARVKKGDYVLVTGAGPMGLLITDIATCKGANVIVSEINDRRRNMAKEFGAKYTIDPSKESLKDLVDKISNGEGVNVLIETTGVPQVMEEAVKLLSPASRVVPLAFGSEYIPLDCKTINQKEIEIAGSRLQYEKFDIVCSYLKDKEDLLNKFVTDVFKAEDYQKAFEKFMEKDTSSIKVVLTF